MTELEKQEVLKSLKGRDADELWGYIKSGDTTLDEMKKAGGMIFDVKVELQRRLANLEDEIKAEAEKETAFWNGCKGKHTQQSYNDYLEKYPNGRYKSQAEEGIIRIADDEKRKLVDAETSFWNECNLKGKRNDYIKYLAAYPGGIYRTQAEACLADITVRESEEKRKLLEEMKDYPEHFDHSRLQKHLDEGILEELDLISEDIITREALKLYLNPPLAKFIDQSEWGDLPTIPEGKTDIYFFGIPGSGKSCVLAGTLYAAEKNGILHPDIKVAHGVRYMNELTNCVRIGYVPKPTNEDCVNCLSFSLNSSNEHPLNVIEMSGEIFKNTYYKLVGSQSGGITAQKYLKNKNRKIIFFVIDYCADFAPANVSDLEVGQSAMLTAVLEILKDDGILEQTDGIVVIISKSDYMPQDKPREEIAETYLRQNYLNFMNILGKHLKSYGINRANGYKPHVIPFSLGKFMLGRTFTYNPDDSAVVVNNLLALSRIKSKKWLW
jgi:hypothetical protein